MKHMSLFNIVLAIILVVVLLAIGPLLVIWSLNTLFPVLAIPYTVWTWAAIILLGTFLRANVSVKRKD
jgi:hypothetical protein